MIIPAQLTLGAAMVIDKVRPPIQSRPVDYIIHKRKGFLSSFLLLLSSSREINPAVSFKYSSFISLQDPLTQQPSVVPFAYMLWSKSSFGLSPTFQFYLPYALVSLIFQSSPNTFLCLLASRSLLMLFPLPECPPPLLPLVFDHPSRPNCGTKSPMKPLSSAKPEIISFLLCKGFGLHQMPRQFREQSGCS